MFAPLSFNVMTKIQKKSLAYLLILIGLVGFAGHWSYRVHQERQVYLAIFEPFIDLERIFVVSKPTLWDK